MSRRTRLAVAVLGLALAATATGCAAAYDDDGDAMAAGPMTPAPVKRDPVPVVVDTDLAPDDLAALTYLMRHPDVEVVAVTVPRTGMVWCPTGLELLADLFAATGSSAPVACGAAPRGPEGVAFPMMWGHSSLHSSGLDRLASSGTVTPTAEPSARLIATLARRHPDLHVVALGPLTDLAALRRSDPDAFARIDGITTMAGVVDVESQDDGIGEWNAAADPQAFAEVLDGPVPVTVVPHDPVPAGVPAGLSGPVVGALGTVPGFQSPAYWDLATAGVFTSPGAATTVETGRWEVDVRDDRGRMRRSGEGPVRVVTALDAEGLDRSYAAVFR